MSAASPIVFCGATQSIATVTILVRGVLDPERTESVRDDPEHGVSTDRDHEDPRSVAAPRAWPVVVAVTVAAALPRLATVGHFFNLDETLWMGRSTRFSDALLHLDPAKMSALRPFTGTMPGIPTVWLGSFGRLIWNIGVLVGVVDPGQDYARSTSGFVAGQISIALAVSALIGFLAWLTARWLSRRVALATGIVLATEPLWVSLGSIVHTDELVALFGLTGLVALAWALGLPDGTGAAVHRRRWMIVSAILLILAALTKMNGLAFGPPAVGMVVWAVVRELRTRTSGTSAWKAVAPILAACGWMVLAATVTVVVTYPALVAAWSWQMDAFAGQIRTAGGDRHIFYLGRYAAHPPISFYPVTLAYSVTPWFFLLAPIGVLVGLARRRSRMVAVTAIAWAVVPMVSLLRSGLVYTRYGLVVLGPLTLAAASALQPNRARTTVGSWWKNGINRYVAGASAAMFVVAMFVAPWGGVTFNPIMSAYRKPILVLPIGWGEANTLALRVIQRDARARGLECDQVTVSGLSAGPLAGSCKPRIVDDRALADYVVVAASTRQRFPWRSANLPADFDMLEVVHLRGQRLVEVWRSEAIE